MGQICCLAQDQSRDKAVKLNQDVGPLTVCFIFRDREQGACRGGSQTSIQARVERRQMEDRWDGGVLTPHRRWRRRHRPAVLVGGDVSLFDPVIPLYLGLAHAAASVLPSVLFSLSLTCGVSHQAVWGFSPRVFSSR